MWWATVCNWSPGVRKTEVKEAVEGTAEDHFVLAVQWHPERTCDTDAASRALFQAFIRAAAEWHKQASSEAAGFRIAAQPALNCSLSEPAIS